MGSLPAASLMEHLSSDGSKHLDNKNWFFNYEKELNI